MSQAVLTRRERVTLSNKLHNYAVLPSLYTLMSVVILTSFCATLPVFCPSILGSIGEVNQEENMGSQGDIDGPSLMNLHVQSYGLGAGSIVCACIIMMLLIWACCCIRQYCPCMQCPMAPPPTQMQTVGLSTGGLGGGGFPSAPPPANPAYAMRENLPDIVPTVGRPRVSVDQNLFRMLAEDSSINK